MEETIGAEPLTMQATEFSATNMVAFADGGWWWLGNLGPDAALDVRVTALGALTREPSRMLHADRIDVYEQKMIRPRLHLANGQPSVELLVAWVDAQSSSHERSFTIAANGHR